MTTCAECLGTMSTMRLADLRPGSAIAEHCSTCADCSSVAQEIAFAERRLAEALAETRSALMPDDLSNLAMQQSERARRKEMARWARGFLMAAGCVTFWFFMQDLFVPWTEGEKIRTETVTLRCLTADQATEIATPYLRSNGASISTPKGMQAVTIRGRHDEFEEAISRVKSIDDAQGCRLPNRGYPYPWAKNPSPNTTSADKQEMD
jgi:hypothetical protein